MAFSHAKPLFLTREEDIIAFPHLSFGYLIEQGTCLSSYQPYWLCFPMDDAAQSANAGSSCFVK